jgi:hypothetical protein
MNKTATEEAVGRRTCTSWNRPVLELPGAESVLICTLCPGSSIIARPSYPILFIDGERTFVGVDTAFTIGIADPTVCLYVACVVRAF